MNLLSLWLKIVMGVLTALTCKIGIMFDLAKEISHDFVDRRTVPLYGQIDEK